jgi:oligoribonuclease (3'-5' exoribonuclease)
MLVWMDLEMTGLDHTSDVIVEIATLITDDDLVIIAEGAYGHVPLKGRDGKVQQTAAGTYPHAGLLSMFQYVSTPMLICHQG